MDKLTLFILLLSFNFFSVEINALKCGENEIDNCKECGKEGEANICTICETGYFLFFENLICLSCNDPIYGQVGCKGECVLRNNVTNSEFVSCNECKEGFINVEGICRKCDYFDPLCSECTYESGENSENKEFKCTKCLNEEEYTISNSKCIKCNSLLNYCNKCHFTQGKGQEPEPECDTCLYGYALSEKKCQEQIIFTRDITGGMCYTINDNFISNFDHCECNPKYVLVNNTCLACPENCLKCDYDELNNSTQCTTCDSNYILNSEKNCIQCDEGCQLCDLDESKNPKCLICESDKFMSNDNKCISLPNNCDKYNYDKEKNNVTCIKCSYGYVLDPESKECISCREIQEIGEGCDTCIYNPSNSKFECETCLTSYYGKPYAYVNNTFQCLSNEDESIQGLYGCEFAKYNNGNYECLQCKNDGSFEIFAKMINSNNCKDLSFSVGLPNNCLEIETIGTKYSCSKCYTDYTTVINLSTNLKNCVARQDGLSYCLEAKIENGITICTKCVNNAEMKDNICSCNSGSFSEDNNWCYKCNEWKEKNPQCDESKGCNYDSENQKITCNKCGEKYYESSQGKCTKCSDIIPNCEKCHFNNDTLSVICDSCINDYYVLNTTNNLCEINNCEEYPDISPGCIICKDKLKEYLQSKKCQMCKYGYFKTKDDKCLYCSSEKNGGLGCYQCGYETNENGDETDKIICKECYSELDIERSSYSEKISYYSFYNYYYSFDESRKSPLLSKEGKCYDCQIQFAKTCQKCELKEDENGVESLRCVSCQDGYYLTNEGNCVDILSYLPKIQNCEKYSFSKENIQFEYYFQFTIYGNLDYKTISETIYSQGLEGFNSECLKCKEGYYVNNEGNCEKLNFEKCSFNSILNNYIKLSQPCEDFCGYYDHYMSSDAKVIIYLKDSNYELNIIELSNYDKFKYFSEFFKGSDKIKTCLKNSGEGGEYAPENLKYCKHAYFYPENNTYVCFDCFYSYNLNSTTHICEDIYSYSCTIGNVGTEDNPRYNCIEGNGYNDYVLITYENNQTKYFPYYMDLSGCVEADANTYYYYPKYNCTKCSFNYIPYYSKFYDKIICQNINEKIIKEIPMNYYYYNLTQDKFKARNGKCQKDNFYTPDGEYCYKCDDEIPGCKGGCDFSPLRYISLKCIGECEKGYIEYSEGICTKCNYANNGCEECHYENDYPSDYTGIKYKRRFVCDYCLEGYAKSLSGECKDCRNLGLDNCNKCQIDPNNKNNYICTKCQNDYFIDENGKCQTCDATHFADKNKKKCVECGNTSEGGINKCSYCSYSEDKAVCNQCLPGYILSITDNSCLEIAKNKELEKFMNCEQLIKENNKYICSKCKYEYTLITRNNIKECLYIRALYDFNFDSNYKKHYYALNKGEEADVSYDKYKENDYIYNKYQKYYPCQEAENLETEENPLYSCKKCYELFIEENIDSYKPVRITEENTKISYCLFQNYNSNLYSCSEATLKRNGIEEIFSCTKCDKNYVLEFNNNYNTYRCSYDLNRCSVPYCQKCNPYDGNICEECLSDYQLNNITGSCMEKMSEVPEIIWRDIYFLNMEGEKELSNKKTLYGPSFKLRGITSSQINSGHQFLINLTLKKIPELRFRNLEGEEDTIKFQGICEILNAVEKITNDVNLVEYDCIGNETNYENLYNFILDKLEEGNNGNLLKKSNLDELALQMALKYNGLQNLEDKIESSFTYEDLLKILIFQMKDQIKSFQAENFQFNFNIDGTLNNEIAQKELNIQKSFDLNEVDDTKATCDFAIKSYKNASLACRLNIENHKNIKSFSFKTSQIVTSDNEIYLPSLSSIKLINNEAISEGEEEEEEEGNGKGDKGKTKEESGENNKRKIYLIAIAGAGGTVGAILIGVIIYFLCKKRNANDILQMASGKNFINNRVNVFEQNSSKRQVDSTNRIRKENKKGKKSSKKKLKIPNSKKNSKIKKKK